MKNQQSRGRFRNQRPALRPMARGQSHARPMRGGPPRPAAMMQPRPSFHPRIASRMPFGISSVSIGRSDLMPAGGLPPRHKIHVNPYFRGSSAMNVIPSQAPSTQPAHTYPKLMNLELGRPQHQHPQFMVKFTKLCLHL